MIAKTDSSKMEDSEETEKSNLEIESNLATSSANDIGEEQCEELQCEEVDMNNHLMDPLEWAVRKTISIPKVYYWESGNYDVSLRTKVWHRSVQTMGMTLRGAEHVGGFFARLFGLNSSRFEDVTAYMNDDDWELAKENHRNDKEERKKYLARKELKKNKIDVI